MDYQTSANEPVTPEIWNEKTVRVLSGGFNLDKTTIPAGLVGAFLPKGVPISIDFETRVAKIVVYDAEAAEPDETVVKTLTYAPVKVVGVANPKVSAVYAADEVQESKLPYALSPASKEEMSKRFFFVP